MTATELFVARAAAVHAYAVCAGVHEDARTVFVLEVLGGAEGVRRADRRLLASARRLSQTPRRAHRRAAREFRAARAAAVPIAVARDAGLGHLLGIGRALAPGAGRAPEPHDWVPAELGSVAQARPLAGPGDWLPAGLRP